LKKKRKEKEEKKRRLGANFFFAIMPRTMKPVRF
jgi:hypothetical protein